jgi:hypothetical protein
MSREIEKFWIENPEWTFKRKLVVLASDHDRVVGELDTEIEKQVRMEKTRAVVKVIK